MALHYSHLYEKNKSLNKFNKRFYFILHYHAIFCIFKDAKEYPTNEFFQSFDKQTEAKE